MPPTGRLKASVSAPRLITAPGSGADLTRVDAQARFHTPPVHIYAMGLDGPRAATSKRLEGNEHYLLPRKKPPNPRQVAMQRELCVGGGRSSRATWAEAKPSTAASEATTMVAPLRTHIPLPPEHRLPNSYLDAERRASAEPQTYGSTALCRNQGLYGRPARPRPGHPMALVKPARRHSDRTLVGVFDTGTGTAAVLMQDVSYLTDRPGHGSVTLPLRHGSPRHFVDYQIPPTQIPEADHVRVAAPQHGHTRLPGSGRAGLATYSSRRPHACIHARRPSGLQSRATALDIVAQP
eukprot:scaffold65381_cov32-Phaeocystis_antarctica.AAC.1